MKTNTCIARIFQEMTGLWHICDDGLPYLDARGVGYRSRREAIAALRYSLQQYPDDPVFTHYLTRSGRKIRLAEVGS